MLLQSGTMWAGEECQPAGGHPSGHHVRPTTVLHHLLPKPRRLRRHREGFSSLGSSDGGFVPGRKSQGEPCEPLSQGGNPYAVTATAPRKPAP